MRRGKAETSLMPQIDPLASEVCVTAMLVTRPRVTAERISCQAQMWTLRSRRLTKLK